MDKIAVTPFAGVWIEIRQTSHGSKLDLVTPFAGVWIEIQAQGEQSKEATVTPFAGVWIEIYLYQNKMFHQQSLPSRECGLKSKNMKLEHRQKISLSS